MFRATKSLEAVTEVIQNASVRVNVLLDSGNQFVIEATYTMNLMRPVLILLSILLAFLILFVFVATLRKAGQAGFWTALRRWCASLGAYIHEKRKQRELKKVKSTEQPMILVFGDDSLSSPKMTSPIIPRKIPLPGFAPELPCYETIDSNVKPKIVKVFPMADPVEPLLPEQARRPQVAMLPPR